MGFGGLTSYPILIIPIPHTSYPWHPYPSGHKVLPGTGMLWDFSRALDDRKAEAGRGQCMAQPWGWVPPHRCVTTGTAAMPEGLLPAQSRDAGCPMGHRGPLGT